MRWFTRDKIEISNKTGISINKKITEFGNGTKNNSQKGKGELECLICHCNFNNLGAHVYQAHNITGKDYKIKFNISSNSLLANYLKKQISKRMLVDSIEMNKKAIPKLKEFWKSEKSKHARKLMSENMLNRYKNGYKLTGLNKLNEERLKKRNEFLKSSKICIICGKKFYPKIYQSRNYFNKQKICSLKCVGVSKRKNLLSRV
jgi:hypothetical protein